MAGLIRFAVTLTHETYKNLVKILWGHFIKSLLSGELNQSPK